MPRVARRVLVPALLAVLLGCGSDPSPPGGGDPDGGGGPPDADLPEVIPPAESAGDWRLHSQLRPGVDLLAPESAIALLETLRHLAENPAEALFDLAEEAGVPAVGTIRDALPGFLEDELEGWINDAIADLTIDGVPVTEVLAGLIEKIDLLRTELDLVTRLELEPAVGEVATGQHTLEEIVFAPLGPDPIHVPASIAEVVGTASLEVRIGWPDDDVGGDATLELGEHFFGLPLGTYLAAAMDDLIAAELGAPDLGAALALLIDCASVAAWVADQCVLGECVGHEADLLAVCEGGLDRAAEKVYERITALDFEAITFYAGTCTPGDRAPVDGEADALDDGVWTAAMNLSQGERPVPATFSGVRAP